MADDNRMVDEKDCGEGNYKAAREYNDGAAAAAKDHQKVSAAAKDAERALSTDEARELEQAEAEGKSHAKG